MVKNICIWVVYFSVSL